MKASLWESFFMVWILATLFSCNATIEANQNPSITNGFVNQNTYQLINFHEDSMQEYNEFVTNVNKALAEEDRKTSQLKLNIAVSSQLVRDKFEKQIEQIEFNSLYLKISISQHQLDSKNNWELFKISYLKQMNELTNLITDLDNNLKK